MDEKERKYYAGEPGWDDGISNYLSVVQLKNIAGDVYVTCYLAGNYQFLFFAQDWQLGYNFFEEFTYHFHGHLRRKITNQKALLNTYIHVAEKIEKWKERKVKGQQGIRLTPSTLCNICKHRTSYTTCKAFPSGIPNDLHNKLHTEKHIS